AEQVLDKLAPAERDAVAERLDALAQTHSGLIDALDSSIDRHADSLDELTNLARQTVAETAAIAIQLDGLRVGLEPLLRRIEGKIDAVHDDVREILRQMNDLAARNHVR